MFFNADSFSETIVLYDKALQMMMYVCICTKEIIFVGTIANDLI